MELCPTCWRETIGRIGGEWCRWCCGWIVAERIPEHGLVRRLWRPR